MKRTAIVHFEDAIHKLQAADPEVRFDSEYYSSPEFLARPNSTLRLSLVNFTALREIARRHPVEIFHYSEVNGKVEVLDGFEQIVINTVASKRTESLLEQLFTRVENFATTPEIIIGTEYSWTNNVRNGNISSDLVDRLYGEHLMLRHTARTDRHVYEDGDFRRSRIQEFELGIHQDALPTADPIGERDGILLVAAPEGRLTKNNDEIYETERILNEAGVGADHRIRVIKPPYTAAEYWDALRSTRYLIFTSRGETFSYVLNDALSMGVIAFRKPELFATRTSHFGVDSYWEVGLRYREPRELPGRIRALSADVDSLRAESFRSSAISKRLFSEEAVRSNWLRVLAGDPLNTGGVLFVDLTRLPGGSRDAYRMARDLDCKLVVAYMSRGLDGSELTSYSLTSEDRSIALVPYCFIEAGGRLRLVSPNLGNGKVVEEGASGILEGYLRLLFRTNRVSRVFVSSGIGDPVLNEVLSNMRYLHGRELEAISVQSV